MTMSSLGGHPVSQGAREPRPLRCAILSVAHLHAAAYATALAHLPDAELVAVWDDDPDRGRSFATTYGAPFIDDLARPGAWDGIDAAIITAENAKHHALCLAACRAGKHVLCEKPLATSLAQAEQMIAAAHAAGVVLGTAFPMRHNLPAAQVKVALHEGALGAVLAVRATNHGRMPAGWFQDPDLAGGGAVMDHTVHVADLLRWYLRDEPVEVYAEISDGIHHGRVDDVAFLTIGFRSGVVATLDPSWSRPPSFPIWGDVTMEIACERGTINLDAFNQKVQYYPSRDGYPAQLGWGADADLVLIADFVTAVRERREPEATGRDGERALAVALAAYESARRAAPVPIAPVTSDEER